MSLTVNTLLAVTDIVVCPAASFALTVVTASLKNASELAQTETLSELPNVPPLLATQRPTVPLWDKFS